MTIRGIDHVGVTVPSIEQATEFFVRALGAQVLYDTLPREDGSRQPRTYKPLTPVHPSPRGRVPRR